MPDREKVIKALEHCVLPARKGWPYCSNIAWSCCESDDCPYYQDDCDQMLFDVLALLKKQEPRVLTLEEVLGGDECWFEYINGSCGYADVYMQDNKTAIIHRTNIRPVEVPITDYIKKWRCWSYRPTDEQRKAVKWDDSD